MLEMLKGSEPRVAVAFTNTATSAAVDPATVVFKYEDPSANVTTLTYPTDAALVKDSTGNYHVDINGDEAGVWFWEWRGTGDNQATVEGSFAVTESRF